MTNHRRKRAANRPSRARSVPAPKERVNVPGELFAVLDSLLVPEDVLIVDRVNGWRWVNRNGQWRRYDPDVHFAAPDYGDAAVDGPHEFEALVENGKTYPLECALCGFEPDYKLHLPAKDEKPEEIWDLTDALTDKEVEDTWP